MHGDMHCHSTCERDNQLGNSVRNVEVEAWLMPNTNQSATPWNACFEKSVGFLYRTGAIQKKGVLLSKLNYQTHFLNTLWHVNVQFMAKKYSSLELVAMALLSV